MVINAFIAVCHWSIEEFTIILLTSGQRQELGSMYQLIILWKNSFSEFCPGAGHLGVNFVFLERVAVFSMYLDRAVLRRLKWKRGKCRACGMGGWIERSSNAWRTKESCCKNPEQVKVKLGIYEFLKELSMQF